MTCAPDEDHVARDIDPGVLDAGRRVATHGDAWRLFSGSIMEHGDVPVGGFDGSF